MPKRRPKSKLQYVPSPDRIIVKESAYGGCAVMDDAYMYFMAKDGKWREAQHHWENYLFFGTHGLAIAAICRWYNTSQQTQTQREEEWRQKVGVLVHEIEQFITRFKAENAPRPTTRPVGKHKPLRVRRR